MKANKRSLKKLLSTVTAISLIASCFSVSASALEPSPEYQGKNAGYTYDFKNIAQMSDFKSFYLPVWDPGDDSKKVGTANAYTENWILDTTAGTMARQKLSEANPGTDSGTAMLYLGTKKFQYFEAELSYDFGASWGWTQLCFGAQELGNYMYHNNAGLFMSQEGGISLKYPGGNDADAAGESGRIDMSQPFTYKLRVTKGDNEKSLKVAIYVKGGKFGADYSAPLIEKNCEYELLATAPGYISIQAQNDSMKLRSFSVKELTADGRELKHPGKPDLQAMANSYDTLKPDSGKFTTETWTSYEAAISTIKTYLGLSDFSTVAQNQIDTALTAAITARNALITKDAKALADLVAEYEALNIKEEDYTAESYQAYVQALTAARNTIADPAAASDKIAEVSAALTAAKNGLTTKADKGALVSAIEAAEGLDTSKYTQNSVIAFTAALEAAKAVRDDNKTTDEKVAEALKNLQDSQALLVEKADKAALQEAVTAAKKLLASQYTTASYKVFKAALDSAEATLANENATSDSVTAVLNALKDAQGKLVKKTAADSASYFYDFDNANNMKDFDAYFLPAFDMGNDAKKMGVSEDYTKHWKLGVDESGNTLLQRIKQDGVNPNTETNNAMLYLKAKKLQYFEAEMTFKFGDNVGWAQLCFGAEQKGNHMYHNNAGIYMQQEGHVNLSCPGGNDAEVKWNSADGAFRKEGLHTMKLRVTAGSAANTLNLTVWADNHDGKGFVKKIEKVIKADNFSDRAGYLSIQTQNDNVAIDSLKVTQLDANGVVIPKDGSASTPQTGDTLPMAALLLGTVAALVLYTSKKRIKM